MSDPDPNPDGEETMPEGKWNYTDHGGAAIQPGQTVDYSGTTDRWQATCGLRFVKRLAPNHLEKFILQQLWQSDSGKREWRDVVVESE